MTTGDQRDLPTGWVRVKLGDVRVDRSRSIDPSKTPDETYELYSVPSFDTGRPEIIQGSDIGSSKKSVEPGTVLVCKINPRINRIWVSGDFTVFPKIASTEWVPFFPIGGINPRFLSYYLQQDAYRDHLASNVSGVGGSLMRVRPATVEQFPLDLPPLNEQHRIVEAIETQFTRLDAAVAALERARANLKRYRAAVLAAACSGQLVPTEAELARQEGRAYEPAAALLERILTERRARWEAVELAKLQAKGTPPKNDAWKSRYKEPTPPDAVDLPELPERWVWVSVDQLADVQTGATPLRSNTSYYDGGIIPWVTSGALNHLFVAAAEEFITERALRETNAKVFPSGTLLVAMYGEGKTRGKISELRIDAATNQACAALVFDGLGGECRPFIKLYFQKNYDDLRRLASGGNQPNLSLGIIRHMALPLPSIAEQDRIVAEVERRLSVLDDMERAIVANLQRAARTRQAILKRAFTGQLVPQNPTDESATALLERILATRSSIPSNRQQRSRRSKPMTKEQEQPGIYAVLESSSEPMPPEQLFVRAGYTVNTVDDFYAELKRLIDLGTLEEVDHDSGFRRIRLTTRT